MTKEMQEYLQTVQECLAQCSSMVESEQEKRRALLGRDTKALESAISIQQAGVMQMENLERRRLAAQEKAGFGGMTARQILDTLPQGEEKEQLQALQDDLRASVQRLQELNQEALKIAQDKIRLYEQFGVVKQNKTDRPTYKPGQPKRGGWSSFERNI